jgi:hypothetical protein
MCLSLLFLNDSPQRLGRVWYGSSYASWLAPREQKLGRLIAQKASVVAEPLLKASTGQAWRNGRIGRFKRCDLVSREIENAVCPQSHQLEMTQARAEQ